MAAPLSWPKTYPLLVAVAGGACAPVASLEHLCSWEPLVESAGCCVWRSDGHAESGTVCLAECQAAESGSGDGDECVVGVCVSDEFPLEACRDGESVVERDRRGDCEFGVDLVLESSDFHAFLELSGVRHVGFVGYESADFDVPFLGRCRRRCDAQSDRAGAEKLVFQGYVSLLPWVCPVGAPYWI